MLTDGLAPDHIVRQFNQMCRLRPVARKVLDSSRANKDDGNQWIVVHSLTDKAIDKLDNDKNTLRVSFRFQWEETTGLIRLFRPNSHAAILGGFWCVVNDHFHEMGTPRYDKLWLGATTHRSTDGTQFMQAD